MTLSVRCLGQSVGITAIGMATGDREGALGEQIAARVRLVERGEYGFVKQVNHSGWGRRASASLPKIVY